jgi:hypothetical protein
MDEQAAAYWLGRYMVKFRHAPTGRAWQEPDAPTLSEAGILAKRALRSGKPVPGWERYAQPGVAARPRFGNADLWLTAPATTAPTPCQIYATHAASPLLHQLGRAHQRDLRGGLTWTM